MAMNSAVFIRSNKSFEEIIHACQQLLQNIGSNAKICGFMENADYGGFKMFFNDESVVPLLLKKRYLGEAGETGKIYPIKTELIVSKAMPTSEEKFIKELSENLWHLAPVLLINKIPISKEFPMIASGDWQVLLDIPEVPCLDVFSKFGLPDCMYITLPSLFEQLRVKFRCTLCSQDGHTQFECGNDKSPPANVAMDGSMIRNLNPCVRIEKVFGDTSPKGLQNSGKPPAEEKSTSGVAKADGDQTVDDVTKAIPEGIKPADDANNVGGVVNKIVGDVEKTVAGLEKTLGDVEKTVGDLENPASDVEKAVGEDEASSDREKIASDGENIESGFNQFNASNIQLTIIKKEIIEDERSEPPEDTLAIGNVSSNVSDKDHESGNIYNSDIRNSNEATESGTSSNISQISLRPRKHTDWDVHGFFRGLAEDSVTTSNLTEIVKSEYLSDYDDESQEQKRMKSTIPRKRKKPTLDQPIVIPERIRQIINNTNGPLEADRMEAFFTHTKKKSRPCDIAKNYHADVAELKAQLETIQREYYGTNAAPRKEEREFMKWYVGMVQRFDGPTVTKRPSRS